MVFDCLERLDHVMPLADSLYIGFGSIWFTDFVMVHRRLGVCDMISMENKPIGAIRAKYNAPFKTVKVEEGDSTVLLRLLARRRSAKRRNWIVWLDYDGTLTPEVIEDIGIVIGAAPAGSVLLVTLRTNGLGNGARAREINVRQMLGAAVSDDFDQTRFENEQIQTSLGDALRNHMIAQAV
jgi:hypothetical protein